MLSTQLSCFQKASQRCSAAAAAPLILATSLPLQALLLPALPASAERAARPGLPAPLGLSKLPSLVQSCCTFAGANCTPQLTQADARGQ